MNDIDADVFLNVLCSLCMLRKGGALVQIVEICMWYICNNLGAYYTMTKLWFCRKSHKFIDIRHINGINCTVKTKNDICTFLLTPHTGEILVLHKYCYWNFEVQDWISSNCQCWGTRASVLHSVRYLRTKASIVIKWELNTVHKPLFLSNILQQRISRQIMFTSEHNTKQMCF